MGLGTTPLLAHDASSAQGANLGEGITVPRWPDFLFGAGQRHELPADRRLGDPGRADLHLLLPLHQLRGFSQAIRMVRGHCSYPMMAAEVTLFQALTAAVSGTVGLGIIVGVAVAVGIGGADANSSG